MKTTEDLLQAAPMTIRTDGQVITTMNPHRRSLVNW